MDRGDPCRSALAVVYSAIFGAQRCFMLYHFFVMSHCSGLPLHVDRVYSLLSQAFFLLFGLARCGLPFSVVECCSDLIRYVVNHLLYFLV